MKKGLILIICILMVWGSKIHAQQLGNDVNPRVSKGGAYVVDSTVVQRTKDTLIKDPNTPMQGGLLSISGLLAVPQGEFALFTNNALGYGIDIIALFNLAAKRSRKEWESRFCNYYVGGNFQWMRQGGKSDFYTMEYSSYSSEITSKVRNSMTGIGAVTRVEFLPGNIKLFLEAGAGTRIFMGNHHYEVQNTPNGSYNPEDVQTITSNKALRTVVLGNYSYGGGIRISGETIGLEVKLLSVKGSKAEYVDLESIRFDRNKETVTYQTKQSTTDMMLIQLGVSGRF